MRDLFRPDALLWRWCSRILDIMALSVFWLVCSIPLVTAGAASAALYDAAVHGVRREGAGAYGRFFRVFRRELRTACPAAALWGAALAGVLWFGGQVGTAVQEPVPALAGAAGFALGLFFTLGVMSWMFPLLSRFEFSFAALNRTAVQFWIAHLPSSAALALLLACCAWLCLRFLFPLFFLPCTEALLASFLVERAFQKHMPPEETNAP